MIDFKNLVGQRILVDIPKNIGLGTHPIDIVIVETNDVCSHVLLVYCSSNTRQWHAISDLANWTFISVLNPNTKPSVLNECKHQCECSHVD